MKISLVPFIYSAKAICLTAVDLPKSGLMTTPSYAYNVGGHLSSF
jgi:hypothetical protein